MAVDQNEICLTTLELKAQSRPLISDQLVHRTDLDKHEQQILFEAI
jgi:hypothetical protein